MNALTSNSHKHGPIVFDLLTKIASAGLQTQKMQPPEDAFSLTSPKFSHTQVLLTLGYTNVSASQAPSQPKKPVTAAAAVSLQRPVDTLRITLPEAAHNDPCLA